MEEQEIDLLQMLSSLKKRWKLILIITLMTTIAAALISIFLINPTYEASTKIFIGKEDAKDQNYNQNDVNMFQRLMKTYSATITTKDLVGRALKESNIDLDTAMVLKTLTVETVPDTQILKIKYEGRDPIEAKKIIENVTKEFITISKELVPNGNIKIIEAVEVPSAAASPNIPKNVVIAFALGLIIGIGTSITLELMDNTFKSRDQLEKEFDIPVIGVIPRMEE